MLMAVLVAGAVLAGAPWQVITAVVLALWNPLAFLVAVAGWAVLARRRGSLPSSADLEAAFLRGLAAELASGQSIRAAVAAAASRSPSLGLERAVRLASAGRSADEIGLAIAPALATNGVACAAAFRSAAQAGGPSGAAFESLARTAEETGRLVRERRALTAQARLSAWVVGGGPVGLAGLSLITDWGPGAASLGSAGPAVIGTGLGLIGAGAAVVWVMVRRAEA
jgi:tight adherence protein B